MKKEKMFKSLKKLTRQKEQGRSMIEILGVLAIIGILSIGGIIGYSMAMNRYRANEILDTASKLSIAAQTAASMANNVNAWGNTMEAVAGEFGLNVGNGWSNHSKFIDGPYESTYSVYDDGAVSVFVPAQKEGLRNAIDSVTGVSKASQGGQFIIRNEPK